MEAVGIHVEEPVIMLGFTGGRLMELVVRRNIKCCFLLETYTHTTAGE